MWKTSREFAPPPSPRVGLFPLALPALAMNDFDPLHPAAYEPPPPQRYRPAPAHEGSDLSSVHPRSPLPGYDRDYRPPGSPAALAVPSPPAANAWGSPQRASHAGGGDDASRAWGGSPQQTQHRPAGQGSGLVPREAQAIDGPNGRRRADSEDGPVRPAQSQAAAEGQQREGFIRVRIVGLERNRRDIYVKFNAETNLPNFHHSSYRAVSRSYGEFMQLVSALAVTCPQSIVPALPLAQTSAATDEEDDRLIKAAFQKWAIRLTSDPAVIRDDETRSFIESDFGYTPRAKKRSASSSYFSRSSRLPGEVDDPLTTAKLSMARLETTFHETAKTVDRVSKTRRATAGAVNELGDQIATFAMAETYAPLANGFKRLARTMKVDADLLAVQSIMEQVTMGDAFVYQSANAKSAKDTLSGRDAVVEEHRQAVKSTITKRRTIEKLRSAASLKPDKVNEALEELDEAQRYEETLGRRLMGISTNLQPSLTRHSVDAHSDLLSSLLEHARTNLIYEKQRLKEFEMLRPEMRNIRKPDAGVIYHTTPSGATMARTASGTSATSVGSRIAGGPLGGQGSSPASSPTQTRTFVGRGGPSFAPPSTPASPASSYSSDPLRASAPDLGSMAQRTQKRTVRSMASSVHVEGDRRQRPDARMAASMLANGF
ncbi:hypothetical protein JCM10207_000389 [Rhodosporidiobolus poonsookiae]